MNNICFETLTRGVVQEPLRLEAGVKHLIDYAGKWGEYCNSNKDMFSRIVAFRSHPFRDTHYSTNFIGDIGVTYSIAPFLHALSHELSYIEEVCFWRFPIELNDTRHQIIAGFSAPQEWYLCSGLTNYSGTGGSGYKKVKETFEAVSFLQKAVYSEMICLDAVDPDAVLNEYINDGTLIVGESLGVLG